MAPDSTLFYLQIAVKKTVCLQSTLNNLNINQSAHSIQIVHITVLVIFTLILKAHFSAEDQAFQVDLEVYVNWLSETVGYNKGYTILMVG